jgi:electron transfer flavoprotein beta subunit
MTIAVLCKWCPDPGDLEVRPDGSISLERAKWSISEYDRVAIEVAASLASDEAGVVAVVAGPTVIDTSMTRKAILSRGPDELFMVVDDRLDDADARQSASCLAAATERIGHVDLVVCGAGSTDLFAQQVGIQVGERLGWPTFNEVTNVRRDGSNWRIERRLDDEVDTLDVALPVALAVTADAALPRVPGMQEILAAGKKPTTVWSLDDLGPSAALARASLVVSTTARPHSVRQQVRFEGSPADAAAELVGALRRESVL